MKKTIYSKFDKDAINDLPQAVYSGRIILVTSLKAAEKAVDGLLRSDILGIDTETRPVFKRGIAHQVALLQVCNRSKCFLFRLNMIGLCAPIVRLLENTTIPMIGLSLHDDITMLQRRGVFTPGHFIDLQNLVGDLGIEDRSLQKLWANIFSEKISKRRQLSNWEAPILSDQQKQYAALDAWACVALYEEILRLKETHEYILVEPPEPEKVVECVVED